MQQSIGNLIKRNRYVFLSIFLVLVSLSFGCSNTTKLKTKNLTITTSAGNEIAVKAEIADTPETREKGFMFRKKIPDGTGMLFIFSDDIVLSFWMKNTPTALSIAYIDYAGRIREIHDMKPQSLASTVSSVSVRYALEVPQGWFSKVGITEGDYLKLDF